MIKFIHPVLVGIVFGSSSTGDSLVLSDISSDSGTTLHSSEAAKIPFLSHHGSPYNEPTKFEIQLTFEADGHARHFRALFNTGSSSNWIERGATSPMAYSDFHERDSFGADSHVETGHTFLTSRSESAASEFQIEIPNIQWEIQHLHATTFRSGAGQIGASIDSGFTRIFPEFEISDQDSAFFLNAGSKLRDEEIWTRIPVIPQENSKWSVNGIIHINDWFSEQTFSFNTGLKGIGLPSNFFEQFMTLIRANGGIVTGRLPNGISVDNCEDLPTISMTLGENYIVEPMTFSTPIDGNKCFVWIHETSEGIELGEMFFRNRNIHFNSIDGVVSISEVTAHVSQ